jgi:hypothetical protein
MQSASLRSRMYEAPVSCREGKEPVDVTPGPDSGINVRTRVQEYGGGETVFGGNSLYFSNFKSVQGWEEIISVPRSYCRV